MLSLHAGAALLSEGWRTDVRLTADADGRLVAVEAGVPPRAGDERHPFVVPAMPNLHSHAFQRAMAGLAERRGATDDSFWTWRETMYRFALTITPEQVEAVAAQAFVEMLEAGFGRVGEFHYLHHDHDGRLYANPAELGERVAAAAALTGIGLTLLPVFYAHSGFGGAPPAPEQRRFVSTLDAFGRLVEGCGRAVAGAPGGRLGIAPHSLRAVTPEELGAVLPLASDGPVHIHVAEQQREVEDCMRWFGGARPVEWLLDHQPVDGRWCLVHATHVSAAERARLAASGAVAGLCPVTEANLGDGTFPAGDFVAAGGHWGVGTDSNVLIGAADELRQLEYSQRLARRARNVLAPPGGSTGRFLYEQALRGGGRALAASAAIAAGHAADLVSFGAADARHLAPDQVLDRFVFTGRLRPDSVWVRGRKLVGEGRHVRREAVRARFDEAMGELLSA